MYTIRATQKLLRRLGPVRERSQAPTTILGDWYANLLRVGRQQLVLCVSQQSLLPVVLAAREVKTELARALPENVAAMLRTLGVSDAAVRRELAAMGDHAVARTESRSILGSMNDFALAIEVALRGHRPIGSLLDLALWLADTPCSPLRYERPRDVARRRLEASMAEPTVDS